MLTCKSGNVTIDTMPKRKSSTPLTDALTDAIAASNLSLLQLSKGSGIAYASLLRFVKGERTLRLDCADKLASYLKLSVHRD